MRADLDTPAHSVPEDVIHAGFLVRQHLVAAERAAGPDEGIGTGHDAKYPGQRRGDGTGLDASSQPAFLVLGTDHGDTVMR